MNLSTPFLQFDFIQYDILCQHLTVNVAYLFVANRGFCAICPLPPSPPTQCGGYVGDGVNTRLLTTCWAGSCWSIHCTLYHPLPWGGGGWSKYDVTRECHTALCLLHVINLNLRPYLGNIFLFKSYIVFF